MLLQNKKVAVIGGGPVGLTFATLLQQAGVHVNVYEWDVSEFARIKGGTLDLLQNMGQKVFGKAGLLEDYFNNARPTARRFADIHGNIKERFPAFNNPEIDRNDLRKILLQSLRPNTVVWDRRFVSLKEQDDKFLLQFENGITETADLVVGANGIMSNVRQQYITGTSPFYTGIVAIAGEVLDYKIRCPNFKRLCDDDKIIVKYEYCFFLSQPKAQSELYYYICFPKPESWIKGNGLNFRDNKQISGYLDDLLADWDSAYKEIFALTDEFTLLPLRQVPLENWRPHKNITLIGDSAHGMPPYAGVGLNTGLMDALYLSENLTNANFKDIQSAIQDYENKMFEYASEAQQETTKNKAALFAKDPKE